MEPCFTNLVAVLFYFHQELQKETMFSYDADFSRRAAPDGQPKFDIADYLQEQHMPF